MSIDLNNPETKTELDNYVASQTSDLQSQLENALSQIQAVNSKNGELLGKLKSNKSRADEYETSFGGLSSEEVAELVTNVQTDENAKLAAEGKFDEAFAKAATKERMRFDAELKTKQEEIEEAAKVSKGYKDKVEQLVVRDRVKDAFIKSGGLPETVDYIEYLSRSTWSLGEDNTMEARDPYGALVQGKKGDLQIDEWVDDMRSKHSHCWPVIKGSGAIGNKGGSASTKAWGKMTSAEQVVYLQNHNYQAPVNAN